MRHPHYQHNKRFIEYFVDHAVRANADSAEAPTLALERSTHVWPFSQAIDGFYDPGPVLLGNASEFLGRAALNPN